MGIVRVGLALIMLLVCAVSEPVAADEPASRGYLGVGLTDAPWQLNLRAALVGPVAPGSPASQAGLRPGDLIRAVDGQAVPGGIALSDYVRSHHPGDRLVFDVVRETPSGFVTLQLTATLTLVPPGASPSSPPPQPMANAAEAGPPPKPMSRPGYVVFRDPAEHAFSVQVPVGWVYGGRLVRYGPLTVAVVVQAIPPDGSIFIQLGDPRIQDFADIPGWRRGQLYTPGTSIMIVRPAESALQYARSYGLALQQKLGCEGPTFTASQGVPNPPQVAQPVVGMMESAMADFTCTRNGKRYVGSVITGVNTTRYPSKVGWSVVYVVSFLARKDRAQLAEEVWGRMRHSFAIDPAWSARESRIAAGAVLPTMRQWESTMDLAQKFDQHVINGEVTVQDPTTGTRSNIQIGANPYYFSDGLGHFYNDYNSNPPPGYHRVDALP